MDRCCASARSARRRAAFLSRTCSGVSPEGSAARHMGHVEKSCSRHFTRQHRWNTCPQSVVNNARFGSASFVFVAARVSRAAGASRGTRASASVEGASASIASASVKKSRRRARSRSRGEKHTAHISSLPTLYPEAGVRGFLRRLRLDDGAEGVLMGVENTRRREPAAGVREGVAALLGGSTFGVATELDARVSEASGADAEMTVSPAISALPRDVASMRFVPRRRADDCRGQKEARLAGARCGRRVLRARRSPCESRPSPRAQPVRARSPFGGRGSAFPEIRSPKAETRKPETSAPRDWRLFLTSARFNSSVARARTRRTLDPLIARLPPGPAW